MPKSCSPAAGLGGSGYSRVDARVRVCIDNHQLVGPEEVDGVINMHSAPWFLRQHPGMLFWLERCDLVLCTGSKCFPKCPKSRNCNTCGLRLVRCEHLTTLDPYPEGHPCAVDSDTATLRKSSKPSFDVSPLSLGS